MTTTMRLTMTRQRALPAACSAVAIVSVSVICASSAGTAKQLAGLALISAFTGVAWRTVRRSFAGIVPAIGLTLTFLILAGLALAAAHALSTVPVALVLGAATLAAAWTSVSSPSPGPTEHTGRLKHPNPLAVTGILIFAAAAAAAVHYSATSATADADAASSVAIWAYPSGNELHVGVEQPAGHGVASLRIVVTQAGVVVATWNNVRLAPGQTWEAPPLALTGIGPAQVVALQGGAVVASLSSNP